MTCTPIRYLRVCFINNHSCACTFDDVVEGMLGLEPKRMEMVNPKPIPCPYVRFAPWALWWSEQSTRKLVKKGVEAVKTIFIFKTQRLWSAKVFFNY